MNKTCPRCGAEMKDCALGWLCPICKTFVDMQDGVHLHKEKPFMPPRTNGDMVRSASDEQLADLFTMLLSKQRASIIAQLHAKGLIPEVSIVEVPVMARAAHLAWLREPAEG